MLAASLSVSDCTTRRGVSSDVLLIVGAAGTDAVKELAAGAQVEDELIDVSGATQRLERCGVQCAPRFAST